MRATARLLVGRTIVAVDFGRKWDPGHGQWFNDPMLTLDNGRQMRFVTQETDTGEYGMTIMRRW